MTAIFYISYALLWTLVIFQSLVLLGLVRTVFRTHARSVSGAMPATNGSLIGQPIPTFTAIDVSGQLFDEKSLPNSLSALLFVTPDCVTCMASLEEINALNAKVNGSLIVVCRAGIEECRRLRETYELDGVPVIVDEDRKVSELLEVYATPTAVLIGANGRIRTYGHPMDKDEFARLVAEGDALPRLQQAH